MSELKNETTEVKETTEKVENEEVETQADKSELTEDDYYALQERLKKAEASLVKYKKEAKAKPDKSDDGERVTKEDIEILKFVSKNPEYEGTEEEIKSYLKKGLTISQAKKLVEVDETVENRAKTKSSSISAGEVGGDKAEYTKDELAKMPQAQYNKVRTLIEQGKASIR